MKSASAVIGAAYGDEGKGLVTDYLVNQVIDPLVIRYNGGAHSSHTVVTNKARHIFGHIGSGSLAGADTFLSEFFVNNPILFRKEYEELKDKIDIKSIKIYVSNNSLITTPFDMILNQMAEQVRGKDKHGSCGIGLGETIERSQYACLRITLEDLMKCNQKKKINLIWDHYLLKRLDDLGITDFYQSNFYKNIDEIFDQYYSDLDFFVNKILYWSDYNDFLSHKNIIFEGAQGLALDMNYGQFPHVTRSNTGLFNILTLCDLLDIENLDIYYVIRAYLTRHGAGELITEQCLFPYNNIRERTNITNEWQGKFRFGIMDLGFIKSLIERDLKLLNIKANLNLVITCMDQVGDCIYLQEDSINSYSRNNFFDKLKGLFPGFNIYMSEGDQRKDISYIK